MSRLNRLAIGLGLTLLVLGCGREGPPNLRMRDPAVPVRSIAMFDLNRAEGSWRQVASLLPPDAAGCGAGAVRILRSAQGGLEIDGALCLAGRGMTRLKGPIVPSGPGRLQISGETEAWWVIWADWDMRSLVLASEVGRFAVVLDRGTISADRLRAAREILDFNGYSVDWLRRP